MTSSCDNDMNAMGTRNHAARLKGREIVTGALAAFALFAMFLSADTRAPIASTETRFVEYSSGGLQIVPASCESTPPYEHYSGECTTSTTCPSGQILVGTQCQCPTGQTWNGTQCVTAPTCPQGQTWNGTQCVTDPACPQGQTWNGTQCVTGDDDGNNNNSSCPIGYTMQNGSCAYTGCPQGYVLQGGQCVLPPQQCTPMNFCAGPDLNGDGIGDEIWRRDAQCTEARVNSACPYGCSGGGCLPAPAGQGNIAVQPALVRSNERSTVTWTTSGMEADSCSITESNPEINDNRASVPASGSFQTSQIEQKTTYTLRCTSLDGTTFMDSATVNVLPVFQEQ